MSDIGLKTLAQMFYEPQQAFQSVRTQSRVWLPLLSLSLLTAALLFWYMKSVDFAWLLDRLANADPSMKPDAREALRRMITPGFLTLSAVGGSLLSIPVLYALYALYYFVVGKFIGTEMGYGKWFAFVVWAGVPGLLALPLMAVQIMTGHGQVAMEDLNMLSLNYLVFHLPLGHPWLGLANSLNLTTVWTVALCAVGLRTWSGRSTASCVTLALVPMLLVYGLWGAKIALFN